MILIFLMASCVLPISYGFIPNILLIVISKAENYYEYDIGKVGDSFTHEIITRKGLEKFLDKHFINRTIIGNGLECNFASETEMLKDFEAVVADVDFEKETELLPDAHFDAEILKEANQRVIDYLNKIRQKIKHKDYKLARTLTAQVLHTIQDFYSHTNWVEMGFEEINYKIGTDAFNVLPMASRADKNLCNNTCEKHEVPLKSGFESIIENFSGLPFKNNPLKYYKCFNNVVTDKLVSGYYSRQKLSDGQPINKPLKMFKCSHGGPFDISTDYDAKGGINKDSAYFWLSPHAHLHHKAAEMAINHTEYFFSQFLQELKNDEFARFLCSPKISWLQILGISLGVLICILFVALIIFVAFIIVIFKIICSKLQNNSKDKHKGPDNTVNTRQYKYIPSTDQLK